jgi:predicted flavoprotein YhiN
MRRLVVVGGGASGVFAAIAAARAAGGSGQLAVTVLEQGSAPLRKVLASGGGRCNVMHDVKPPRELVSSYPRGSKQLLGPFSARFSPAETRQWFEREGVELKVERDGRVFPTTDKAETIAAALRSAAADAGVETVLRAKVLRVRTSGGGGGGGGGGRNGTEFTVEYEDKRAARSTVVLQCSAVLLATGSAPAGYELARCLGHRLIDPYPSLFSFRVEDIDRTILAGLAGLALPDAALSLEADVDAAAAGTAVSMSRPRSALRRTGGKAKAKAAATAAATRLTECGPLLVTHRGLSGPAALKLSAFGAAELRDCRYRGSLVVSTVQHPSEKRRRRAGAEAASMEYCKEVLVQHKAKHGAQRVLGTKRPTPFLDSVPRRWWTALAVAAIPRLLRDSDTTDDSQAHHAEASTSSELRWANVRKDEVVALAQALSGLRLSFRGKDTNKDEFVSAGGVDLSDVRTTTMESKLVPNLYFSGELLNVDGVTGGFNFQAAWTTGYTAGQAAAAAAAAAVSE